MVTKSALAILLVAAVALLPSIASAEVLTTSGASDARGNREWGGGFYPYNTYFVDSQDSATLTSDYDPWTFNEYKYSRVPVLEFSLAPVGGGTISEAILSIYAESVGGFQLIRYCGGDDDGIVGTGDWLNAGTEIGQMAVGTSGWLSYDVTSSVQQSLNAGHSWAVFSMAPGDWFCTATIRASEYGDGFGPRIDVVPEPTTLYLLLVGAGFLLGRRRLVRS